ncbi:MAG: hypothetical protein Q9211_001473 [Gyalolechia sp. 1 TL-2023]
MGAGIITMRKAHTTCQTMNLKYLDWVVHSASSTSRHVLTFEDAQHNIWLVTLDNGLYRAPIPANSTSVLDVGTGSGIWALDFANRHPNSHVLGIDLSPVKPNSAVPKNCTFRVHNAESQWDFGDLGPFDLIHSRMLVMGMRDWRSYFKKCYDHLQPGGWVEAHEVWFPSGSENPSTPADSPYLRWSRLVHEGLARGGIDGRAAEDFPKMLGELGFEDIVEDRTPWAVGPWPQDAKARKIGELEAANLYNGLEGMTVGVLTKNLGWAPEDVDEFVAEVKNDIYDVEKKYILNM